MAGVNSDGIVNRAQGCLLGQLAGDALGSLVEEGVPPVVESRRRQANTLPHLLHPGKDAMYPCSSSEVRLQHWPDRARTRH